MPRSAVRNRVVSARLTAAERREVVRAARAEAKRLGREVALSDYLRQAALAYSRREVVVVPESMEGAA